MEKTFDELIEEKFGYDVTKSGKYLLTRIETVTIMQQVREATIAECRDIASEFSLSETLKHIDNLPTNSIKTDL